MATETMRRVGIGLGLYGLLILVVACATERPGKLDLHRWWAGLGPVLPHDSFPAECETCHVGNDWQTLHEDFVFDHEAETGYALEGAHTQAQCLRCHNDRGPVEVFASQGCAGCHEDIHFGQFVQDCTFCHSEISWKPNDQFVQHYHSRFPLVGAHAVTACFRCHPGSEVGKYVPVDVECLTCHRADLAAAVNPNHLGLGWVDRCDRCHLPVTWQQAELNE